MDSLLVHTNTKPCLRTNEKQIVRQTRHNISLFVFSIADPKQNVNSFMTPFSDSVFYALSHGSLGFAFHGSFFNHVLIGQNSSTANQNL